MANETLSTALAALQSIAIAQVQLLSQARVDLTSMCTRRDLLPGQVAAKFPKVPASTAAALTEGDSASNTAFAPTSVTLTPTYAAVYKEVITDLAAFTAAQDVQQAAQRAANAIRRKKNQDVFALFDGFSTSIGTTNTDITADLILTGKKKLMQSDEDTDQLVLVITPEVFEDLWLDLKSSSGSQGWVSDVLRDAIMAGKPDVRILGVRPWVVSSGISEVGDVKCGLFLPTALGYATIPPEIHVGVQRNEGLIGAEFVFSAWYAVGEINDAHGIEIIADGTD